MIELAKILLDWKVSTPVLAESCVTILSSTSQAVSPPEERSMYLVLKTSKKDFYSKVIRTHWREHPLEWEFDKPIKVCSGEEEVAVVLQAWDYDNFSCLASHDIYWADLRRCHMYFVDTFKSIHNEYVTLEMTFRGVILLPNQSKIVEPKSDNHSENKKVSMESLENLKKIFKSIEHCKKQLASPVRPIDPISSRHERRDQIKDHRKEEFYDRRREEGQEQRRKQQSNQARPRNDSGTKFRSSPAFQNFKQQKQTFK